MSAFRVLLINPRATYADEIAQKSYPPLNLLYLATALRQAGHVPRIVEANAQRLSDEQIVDAAAVFRPDLIGVPLYTEIMAPVYRMVSRLAEAAPCVPVVLGGPHASALPDDVFLNYPQVGLVMRGESELSLPKLCQAIRDRTSLADVEGLSWRNGAEIVHNAPAGFARDLDSVGFPARDLVQDIYDAKLYYTLLVRQRPVDTIMTSRGCPFHCGFCYNQNHTYRFRSTDHVMDEIVSIRRRGIRNIEIVDDTFTVDRDRAMEVLGRIERERLGISFRLKSRVNAVDKALLDAARRAGAYLIAYGCESADDAVLSRMNKRVKVSDIERAIRLTKEAGIACHTSWVLGYPGETPESIERTVEFIIRAKPATAQIALLRPYPQTQVYQEAREAGTLEGGWGARSVAYPWVRMPWAPTREALEKVVRAAARRVYWRPYYAWQFGKMILSGLNVTLARYAAQELGKSIGIGRTRRPGSV